MLNQISKKVRTVVAVCLTSLFLALSAHAAAFVVTKTADTNDSLCDADCSLREAVAAANAAGGGDDITFDPAVFNVAQTITLTGGPVSITGSQSLSITGNGAQLITIDCANTGVLFVTAPSTAAISNLKITGNTGGGSPRVQNNGTLTLDEVVISNGANVIGIPALFNNGGNVTVTDSVFQNNVRTALSSENGGTANISSTLFTGNGTAILNVQGNMTVTNSTMTLSPHTPFHNREGTASLENVVIEDNTINDSVANGAAIVNDTLSSIPAVLTITNSRINNNRLLAGTNRGAGLFNWGGSVTLDRSVVSNNRATGDGGGIYSTASGSLNITNSTIAGNIAAQSGGGIYVAGGTITLSNATVAGNLASGTASGGGGGIVNGGGTINSRNTIIADNVATVGTSHDVNGAIVSQGYNLIENTTGATISGNQTGNIVGQDPQLLPLRNNGGPTFTIALQPTSPAIDSADPANFLATDQRGISRPQDGDFNGSSLPDIGAYERKLTSATVTKTADTNDGMCDADCSLREALATLDAAVSPDIFVSFDAGVFGSPQTIVLASGQLIIPGTGTVVIAGPGANLLAINGNNLTRVILLETGAVAFIRDVTISGGNDTAASSDNGGGGIRVQGILTLRDSVISGNRAANFAGAVYPRNGRIVIDNCLVANNMASSGGAIYINNGSVSVTNSTFDQNSATIDGGAIVVGLGTLTASNINVMRNTAARSGGGIDNDSTSIIDNSRITNNTQTGTAGGGGAGGGLANGGTLTVTNTTISGNTARTGAGISNGSSLNISKSVVSGNIAVKNGGGFYNTGGPLTMANTTITNNAVTASAGSTEGFGGGFFHDSFAASSVTSVTIAGNSAGFSGGGVHVFGSALLNMRNSIIADNVAGNSGPDFLGNLNSQGYNLVENTSGTMISGTTTGNILGQDPKLGLLAANGGPTMTRALLPGSPAIDTGDPANPLATDQRSVTRPKDGDRNGSSIVDIGAFERDPAIDTAPFDFDGDGKTDVGIFRPPVGEWWYQRSSDSQVPAFQFGNSTDRIVPADFTGDGKTDIAIFRPSIGEWFVLRSENGSFYSFPFGTEGDIPVPADYDNDGKADAAVFRPSNATWYIQRSTGGTTIEQFGSTGDVPVPADYDGDGKADLAIFRPSNGQWWLNRSTAGVIALTFGNSSDKQVQGDYTGDGKADVAFWRPSTGEWFVLRSEDFSYYSAPFGASTDIAAPGDYDGDGKMDTTVFRPSTATWFSLRSTGGTVIQQFGATGDTPIPSAFVP